MGNNDVVARKIDSEKQHKPVTRQEDRWQSNVFAESQLDKINRRVLSKGDAGRGGYYGDEKSQDIWQRRQETFAGVVSQKQNTRPPQFDDSGADDRKMKELYGNSHYEPLKKDWYYQDKKAAQPQKTPVDKEDHPLYERKYRKAANLQSNVLTHEDPTLREERTAQYDAQKTRISQASNAGWNAQTGYQKPINAGKVDAYRMRQNQLHSEVLEQTDYSNYAPLGRKQVDMNNMYSKPDGPKGSPNKKVVDRDLSYANGNWTSTDTKGQIKKDYTNYDRKDMKHQQMASSLDDHGFQHNAKNQEE